MSCRNEEDLSFRDFRHYPSKRRKEILNDPEQLKIMIRKTMKESRYLHSLSVAETAAKLAEKHHVDQKKAYTAGLLHDVTKDLPIEEQDEYLRYFDPEKLEYPDKVKHSFSAVYYLKDMCKFHDKDILHAIYNHTICTSHDKLSIILYIADKREPLRGVDDGLLELAYTDLYKAYDLLTEEVREYLERRGTDDRIIESRI